MKFKIKKLSLNTQINHEDFYIDNFDELNKVLKNINYNYLEELVVYHNDKVNQKEVNFKNHAVEFFIAVSYLRNLKVLDMNVKFDLQDCINMLGDVVDSLENLETLQLIA